jgi:hypothetical protein
MNSTELKNEIRNFINRNRQMYNTTICVDAALKHDAIFIIGNINEKHKLKKLHPKLKCYTLGDFEHNIRGLNKSAIIFDANAVYQLCHQDLVEKSSTVTYNNQITLEIGENKPLNNQVNVKLSDDQLNSVKELNQEIFEGTASLSNMVRLLIVKGLKYYNEMI